MNYKVLTLALSLSLAGLPAAFAADNSTMGEPAADAKQTGRDIKQTTKDTARETGDYMSDSAITTKVKAALLTEKNLKSLGIGVETSNGVVTLSGNVPSSAEIKQAEDVTKHVKGVKDVHNDLHLKTDKG